MPAALLFAVGIFGPLFGQVGRSNHPPQPYTEKVTLPGRKAALQDVAGDWQYHYTLDDAQLEEGRAKLFVDLVVRLHQDGRYELAYGARWGDAVAIGPKSKGVQVNEKGFWSLSGEVLLLEPSETKHADISSQSMTSTRIIDSHNLVRIVHIEKKNKLHVAGRCAQYQVDPICRTADHHWFSMTAEVGKRWLPGR